MSVTITYEYQDGTRDSIILPKSQARLFQEIVNHGPLFQDELQGTYSDIRRVRRLLQFRLCYTFFFVHLDGEKRIYLVTGQAQEAIDKMVTRYGARRCKQAIKKIRRWEEQGGRWEAKSPQNAGTAPRKRH